MYMLGYSFCTLCESVSLFNLICLRHLLTGLIKGLMASSYAGEDRWGFQAEIVTLGKNLKLEICQMQRKSDIWY